MRYFWLASMTFALSIGFAIGTAISISWYDGGSANSPPAVEQATAIARQTAMLEKDGTAAPTTKTPLSTPEDPGRIAFSGQGGKSTETFRIEATKFNVRWTTETADPSAFFFLSVYEESQNFAVAEASFRGSGSDSTVVRAGPGDFYIEVISGAAWQIEVTFE